MMKNKKEKKRIRVNRAAFMGWVSGDLMEFRNGVGYCNDSIRHEEAEKALERGEVIELADKDGNVLTTMKFDKERGGHFETRVGRKGK